MIYNENYTTQTELIAFDLDGTLVRTKSGKTFAVDEDDWEFTELVGNLVGPIVIFTNQNYKNNEKYLRRVQNIIAQLPVPVIAYVSTKSSNWKKPFPTMMYEYLKEYPEPTSMLYVGDAAGRPGDHSDSDRAFAHNIDILFQMRGDDVDVKFMTPEEFMGGPPEPFEYRGFDSELYLQNLESSVVESQEARMVEMLSEPTLIITVGPPGSGKTTFANRLAKLGDITIVDESNKKKRLRVIRDAPGSVICSQTNPKQADRDLYVAQKPNYRVVVVHWDNMELAKHMNYVRFLMGNPKIPEIAYRIYSKNLDSQGEPWLFDAKFDTIEESYTFKMRF